MSRSLVALRTASPTDAPMLAELWCDVLRKVGPEDQVAEVESVLTDLESCDTQRIVVAEYDGEFAGAVHLRRRRSRRSTASPSCAPSHHTCCRGSSVTASAPHSWTPR
jgi:hypothetical protein